MAKFNVRAMHYGTVCFHTEFTVDAESAKEAKTIAEGKVEKSEGNDTEEFTWEESFVGVDGEYIVEVEA